MKLLIAFLCTISMLFGQVPVYYNSVDFTDSPENVKTQLADLITNTHTNITTYSQAWDILMQTDADPNDSDYVVLIYGSNDNDSDISNDRTRLASNNGGNSGEWNREHVFAKGLGTPTFDNVGPGADPHALRACDVTKNNQRGSHPFTYGSGADSYNPGSAWYPGDEWKGDVARMIMYMYLRYGDQCQPNNSATNSSNSFHPDMPDVFLTWNIEDPVSVMETQRNDLLEIELGNRNPFIDNPYLATLIWGGDEAENTWNLSIEDLENQRVEFYFYPNPVKDIMYFNTDVESCKIFSESGNIILESKENEINISNLPKGIYWIELSIDNQLVKKSFLKK